MSRSVLWQFLFVVLKVKVIVGLKSSGNIFLTSHTQQGVSCRTRWQTLFWCNASERHPLLPAIYDTLLLSYPLQSITWAEDSQSVLNFVVTASSLCHPFNLAVDSSRCYWWLLCLAIIERWRRRRWLCKSVFTLHYMYRGTFQLKPFSIEER